jgi:uncharacterized protein (DUF488 family)
MQNVVFTIGHSTQAAERFIMLLKKHGITAVADVRSTPYSRMNPQYNREDLRTDLNNAGISYVFLGKELGARSENKACYHDGKVQYGLLAQTDVFRHGIDRVREGAQNYRIALMCAEKEPLECHRTILVARELERAGLEVQHILGDGRLESHVEAMNRLVRLLHLPEGDMFSSREDVVAEAYRLQEERVAYTADAGVAAGTVRSAAG